MLEHDNDERSAKASFSRRAILVGGAQAAGFGLLGWRLFNLQVLEQGRYAPLADENRINLQVITPKRGRILDSAGNILADNDDVFRATLTPALAGDVTAILAIFRRIVPMTPEEIEKIARRTKKQSRNVATVIATDLTFEQVAKINLFAPQLPGVRTEIAWRRRYRQGAAVGHITGFVGSVERAGVEDNAVLRLPGARIGKSGIEAGLESLLRGTGGAQKIEVDARGRTVRNLAQLDAKPGQDVTLTVDTALQRKIIERLQQDRRASIVVLDIASGAIVAMASTPGYDPADIADGISEEAWQRLAASEDKPMLNRAVSGQYPPGSTFKMVTALAALQAGLIDTSEKITCEGKFELADQTYRCWNRTGHGPMSLYDAIRSSCDVYFFELARRLGIEALADIARMCGLGMAFDCGLAEEKTGVVPDPDWKRGKGSKTGFSGEAILAGIGQGYMLATPLQLAVMTARVASGKMVVPTLIKAGPTTPLPVFAKLPIDQAHLDAVRSGLIAVVNEDGGTGTNAVLSEGRPKVAGKTGTTQISQASSETTQDDLDWSQRDHALFVAYVPADAPRYAFSAIVEHGGGGGATAAPLVRDVMTMVLDKDAAATAPGVQGPGAPGSTDASKHGLAPLPNPSKREG